MSGYHRRKTVNSAFTLIELLVVIAIIALLAAILFPVFARARENARKSSCANNLKQLSLGLAQYAQDFDESLTENITGNAAGAWTTLIQPYVRSTQALTCPSRSNVAIGYGFSYRMSQASTTVLDDSPHLWTQSAAIADLKNTAGTIMLTDAGTVTNTAAAPVDWTWNTTSNSNGYVRFSQAPLQASYPSYTGDPWRPIPVHLGGTNCAFVDGHVKFYPIDKIVNGQRMGAATLWDNN